MGKKRASASAFAALALAVASAWSGVAIAQVGPEYHYRLEFQPASDRTDLVVNAEISGLAGQSFEIGLPADCYGSPDLHRAVVAFEGVDGSQVAEGADPARRSVKPGQDGVARLRYRLSFDPLFYDGHAFGPNTGAAHAHVAGCQWLLSPAESDAPFDYTISLESPPPGWTLYSSLAANAAPAKGRSTYDELATAAIGGGTAYRRVETEQGPVDIFISEGVGLNRVDVASAIERVVRAQRDRFGAEGQDGFYVVSVNPRSGVMAGTAIDNLFVTFVRSDASELELVNLIAHEMFHNEVPMRIGVRPPVGVSATVFEWFGEGVAEFGARRLMLDSGIIDADVYASLYNDTLERLRLNSARDLSSDQMTAVIQSGGFTGGYKKLAYYRGSLMALAWDVQLRRAGHSEGLFHLLAALRSRRDEQNKVSADILFEEGRRLGLDIQGDYERAIVRGERIVPPADLLAPTHTLRQAMRPSRVMGFDLAKSQKDRVIAGVDLAGPAYAAGLRDGMALVRTENTSTDINGSRLGRPVVLHVAVDGRNERITYMPEGPSEPALSFEPL